jgi:NADPH:quinone reductase-like Zn-dependent oxidoreductase
MKAIVQAKYGSPDVLQVREINKPVAKNDQVLVRVRAAAVNIGDWHLLRGMPYVMRVALGLTKPRRELSGIDVAGEVEAIGPDVHQLRPGDEVRVGAKARSPSTRVLPRTTSCRSQPTSRSNNRPRSETRRSPHSPPFAIKGRCSRGITS